MITNNLLENCTLSHQVKLSELLSSITLKAALTPGVNYIVKTTDKFGNSFSTGPLQAAADGSLVITIPQSFPQQWLNRNAGKFLLQVSQTANPWAPVALTFAGNAYTGVVMEFAADDTTLNMIE